MKTRREFLGLAAGAVVLPGAIEERCRAEARRYEMQEGVPEVLDHILLGCADLQQGIAFVEEKTGVKAAFGGVHPGRGTQNALLSLGERHYLEIIAPDPKQAGTAGPQSSVERLGLRGLKEPKLVTWAVHPGSAAELAEKLKKAGIVADGPTPGSRKRPDGRLLQWQTVNLAEDAGGLLPFFIEWGAGTVHPSLDAPKGCVLRRFWIESPKAEELAKQFAAMGVDVEAKRGEKTRLRARISGPKGEMEL
jgi:glyoxalase-like protein